MQEAASVILFSIGVVHTWYYKVERRKNQAKECRKTKRVKIERYEMCQFYFVIEICNRSGCFSKR